MTRSQRNADYVAAGAPALQDTDPEPSGGMSRGYWRLMTVIGIAAVLVYVVAVKGMLC